MQSSSTGPELRGLSLESQQDRINCLLTWVLDRQEKDSAEIPSPHPMQKKPGLTLGTEV